MTDVIAIFDIGKTNKKAFLFDDHYQIVWEHAAYLEETVDEEGDPCEDVALLTQWVLNTFETIKNLEAFEVKALNFSAYGASFLYVDEFGKLLTPLYNYLKSYPEELQKQFYNTYGGAQSFALSTASPMLGNLNSGMQIYRLKHQQAEVFSQVKHCLHLPQYLSYLFTKKACSETTSIGCHTGLWDFQNKQYHEWVRKEGVFQKLPPISESAAVVTKPIVMGTGLHDSSAALVPYFKNIKSPFVLISTGTWNISLNPFNDRPLTFEELEQDCLCYISFQGNPVKASRLFAGNEHEEFCASLAEKYKLLPDFFKNIAFDENILNDIQTDSWEGAYYLFIKNLIDKQVKSTDLILNGDNVKQIFVDGGFARNEIFMKLLSAHYSEMEVYAAEVAQASALGAALVLHDYWNPQAMPEQLVSLKKY